MNVDLHMHSRCSDGSDSAEELMEKAASRHLHLVSLTDHDTVEGIERAGVSALRLGLKFIPGIEISAFDYRSKVKAHILGYGFSTQALSIRRLCGPILAARHANTLRQIRILKEAGYDISVDDVRNEAGESTVLYKQHIMSVLITKGYTDTIYSSLYRTLFKGDGIAAGDIHYVDVIDAVRAITNDGGLAVLAHPGQQNTYHLIRPLARIGLGGVELKHPDHSAHLEKRILEETRGLDLVYTGGSDYHGCYGSTADLGSIQTPKGLPRLFQEIAATI